MALVDRAAKAGFDTLLVTVDVPVAGARLRDKRNGFGIPPALTLGTVVNALPRPAWWINFLTTEPLARTMKLLGVATMEGLNPSRVTQLVRLAPRRTI